MFSISASSSDSASSRARSNAGIDSIPASCAARQRRSPAISSKCPSGSGRTSTGCSKPRVSSEPASAANATSSKCRRGWRGLGKISSTATWRNSSTALSGSVETAMIAARPRPIPRGRPRAEPPPSGHASGPGGAHPRDRLVCGARARACERRTPSGHAPPPPGRARRTRQSRRSTDRGGSPARRSSAPR